VGFDAVTGSWVAAGDASGTPFADVPQLDGELSFDPETRKEYANDYGRVVHEQPLAVRHGAQVDQTLALQVISGEGHQLLR
jgi:hypothetical protein